MIFGRKIANHKSCCRETKFCVSTMAFFVLFLASLSLNAQKTTDFGGILQAEYQNNIVGNWDVWVKEDLRFDNNFSQYSRSKTTLGVDYKFARYGFKVGAGFDYINKYTGKHIFRNRYRFFVNASYKYEYRNWEFGYRTRFLTMYHDERTGYYNYEPEFSWRNKLSVSYQRPYSRYKYTLYGELYSDINRDKQLELSTLLLAGEVDYRLTRRQHLTFFVRDYRDFYIESDQFRTIFFGLGWKFKH